MKWMEEHHDIEVNYIEGDDVTQVLKMLLKVSLKGGIQGVLQDGELDDWIVKTDKKESKDYSKRTSFIIPKRIKYHQATHRQTSSYTIRWKRI